MKEIFQRMAELLREGRTFALATVIGSEGSTPRSLGARMIVYPDGNSEGTVGGGALEKRVICDAVDLIAKGGVRRSLYDLGMDEKDIPLGMICGGKAELLIETFGMTYTLFIFGAGHVGKKLAELCGDLGVPHWIIDNREPFAQKELFPAAGGVVHAEFNESFSHLPIDESSYIVIVTYSHQYDGVCLEGALKTSARYIGMIGSRKKVATLLQSLEEKGVNVRDERIYAPIGLELGDSSPEQISISILAEILKLHSGGSGRHMKDLLQG
jgi:xanthine dehydrogenase accessory factor